MHNKSFIEKNQTFILNDAKKKNNNCFITF